MAIATSLRCVFTGPGDRNISMTFLNADATVSAAQVRNLMQVIVANGDIFGEEPTALVGAEFISREVRDINIS
jgi:hypothetical protein